MKTYIRKAFFVLLSGIIVSAASAQKIGTTSGGGSGTTTTTTKPTTTSNTGSSNPVVNFTQGEAASAIKEALSKGVNVAVQKTSVTDGFFKNQFIKILFPPEARQAESTLRKLGLNSLVDNFILSMNRAAEGAAKQAGPIFLNAITKMTVTDAVNIVSNKQTDAATRFLERTTTEQLVMAFKPSIKSALDKTLATRYWTDITTRYNRIPFIQRKVNTDLTDYVTRKAISGMFYMVAQEEAKIRKDPATAASNVVDKVFGVFKPR